MTRPFRLQIREIENGFLITWGNDASPYWNERYCGDLDEVFKVVRGLYMVHHGATFTEAGIPELKSDGDE